MIRLAIMSFLHLGCAIHFRTPFRWYWARRSALYASAVFCTVLITLGQVNPQINARDIEVLRQRQNALDTFATAIDKQAAVQERRIEVAEALFDKHLTEERDYHEAMISRMDKINESVAEGRFHFWVALAALAGLVERKFLIDFLRKKLHMPLLTIIAITVVLVVVTAIKLLGYMP